MFGILCIHTPAYHSPWCASIRKNKTKKDPLRQLETTNCSTTYRTVL